MHIHIHIHIHIHHTNILNCSHFITGRSAFLVNFIIYDFDNK